MMRLNRYVSHCDFKYLLFLVQNKTICSAQQRYSMVWYRKGSNTCTKNLWKQALFVSFHTGRLLGSVSVCRWRWRWWRSIWYHIQICPPSSVRRCGFCRVIFNTQAVFTTVVWFCSLISQRTNYSLQLCYLVKLEWHEITHDGSSTHS